MTLTVADAARAYLRSRRADLMTELRELDMLERQLSGKPVAAPAEKPTTKTKRKVSAATRAKQRAAQKARWAAKRAAAK